MARTKSTDSTTSTDEKKPVEAVETSVIEKEVVTENKVEKVEEKSTKTKALKDDELVIIQNPKYAYKRTRVLINVYNFDKDGKAEVLGRDAKLFLNIQGFALVK